MATIGEEDVATVVSWKLYPGGIELPVEDWSIERSRDCSPMSFTLNLKPEDDDYSETGSLAAFHDVQSFDASWNVITYLICTITQGGRPDWVSPKMIVEDGGGQLKSGTTDFSVQGTCHLQALVQEDQFMSQVRCRAGSIFTVQGVVTEIFEHFGVPAPTYHFTDRPCLELDRVGVPMDWVQQALKQVAGYIVWEDGAYHIYAGGRDVPSATADLQFVDFEHGEVMTFRSSSGAVKNEATCERTDLPVAGLNQPRTGITEPFLVEVELDNELTSGVMKIWVSAGSYTNLDGSPTGYWKDADDNYLTVGPTFYYSGSTPAKKVQFNITPPNDFTREISWTLEVPGTVHLADLGPYDANYSATYTDDDVAKRGRRPFPEPFTMRELAPGYALEAATIIVNEGMRGLKTSNLEALLDTRYIPGKVIAVTATAWGWNAKKFQAEHCAWSGSRSSRTMTVDLTRNAA